MYASNKLISMYIPHMNNIPHGQNKWRSQSPKGRSKNRAENKPIQGNCAIYWAALVYAKRMPLHFVRYRTFAKSEVETHCPPGGPS